MNFMAAEGICINFGGHLTSIHSMFENAFVNGQGSTIFTDNTSTNLWAGANTLIIPGYWSWMDGTSFDFTDWDVKQPQNTSDNNCAAISLENGRWMTENCNKEKPFVCLVSSNDSVATTQSPPTTPPKPKSCSLSWTAYNGYCYKVYENANWLDAEDRCKVDDANLASIHDLEENLFIAHLAYYNGADGCSYPTNAWVGLFTEDENAHWNWTDKTIFNYPNWMPGHPNPPQIHQNCGYIFLAPCTTPYVVEAGNFDNAPCITVLSKFVCKKLAN